MQKSRNYSSIIVTLTITKRVIMTLCKDDENELVIYTTMLTDGGGGRVVV